MDLLPISTGSPPKRVLSRALAAIAAALALGALPATAAGVPGLEPKLLPAEQAFRFSARALDAKTLEARFDVADGYYLYRDRMTFAAATGGPTLGVAALPPGKRKHDEFFGDVETYRGSVVVKLPVVDGTPGQSVVVTADSQGCADIGVCYPPSAQQVRLTLPALGAGPGPVVEPARAQKGLFK